MLRSVVVKNIALFLVILVVAVVPLAYQYDKDSRQAEIQNLASKLEFFGERGATWLDVEGIATLTGPEQKRTAAYRGLLAALNRIKDEFGVDNAIVMRREPSGRYHYIAAEHAGFEICEPAHIHRLFPATYKATEDTWSEKRTKYGAVGAAINMAYRIESQTVGGQVLISPSTYACVRDLVQVRGTVEARLKGLERPLTLYDVSGIGGPYAVVLPERTTETLVALEPPLPLACYRIDGKRVADTAVAGRLTRLGERTAEARLDERVEVRENLKVVLRPDGEAPLPDAYAKVLEVGAVAGTPGVTVSLAFTSLPPDARQYLDARRAVPVP